jgi:acyl dehydratase
MKQRIYDEDDAFQLVGQEIGVSSWIEIDQRRITEFGLITEDPDPMHIDPQWAARNSPYGTTIAFGFLTISLMTRMLNEVIARPQDEVSTLNYGFDRLRLLSPVRVGARVRGRVTLKQLALRAPTQFRSVYGVVVEIEGEERPALVADWIAVTNVERSRTARVPGS